jgi:hypothetical protein
MQDEGAVKPKAAAKPKALKRLTRYVVFEVQGDKLKPVNVYGGEVSFPQEVPTIEARTSQDARDQAFEHLTNEQPAEERDAYTVPLVALAAGGWAFEQMAWQVKREVAR